MQHAQEKHVQNFVGKPEGKGPFRRSEHKWKDIKMDLREMGYKLAQQFSKEIVGRLVNPAVQLQVS